MIQIFKQWNLAGFCLYLLTNQYVLLKWLITNTSFNPSYSTFRDKQVPFRPPLLYTSPPPSPPPPQQILSESWGQILRKTWCMWPYAGVDYNLTLCPLQSRLQHICHGHPYGRVDLNPAPESTLFPSQGLWIWPLTLLFNPYDINSVSVIFMKKYVRIGPCIFLCRYYSKCFTPRGSLFL